MTKRMTGAELRSFCSLLGISFNHLSTIAGVSERTADYWITGGEKVFARIPEDVEAKIREINSWVLQLIRFSIAEAQQQPREQPIVLFWYKVNIDLWLFHPELKGQQINSAMFGAAMIRLWENYHLNSVDARIVYMEPEKYLDWLNGRKDNLTLRQEWGLNRLELFHKICG